MIEITIKVDPSFVEKAVGAAWARAFTIPEYNSDRGGAGWAEVTRQVERHIEGMDFSEMITRAAKAKIDDVVNEVVSRALRDAVKKKAKQMENDGTLL